MNKILLIVILVGAGIVVRETANTVYKVDQLLLGVPLELECKK